MKVDLPIGLSCMFNVSNSFISEFDFIKYPLDHKCLHILLIGNVLKINIDPISHDEDILDGPNGVLKWLAIRDGSFAGSIPHDVVWYYAKEIAKKLNIDESRVRKFGDNLYTEMVYAYEGKKFWTKLTNRFCFNVAFPFGNFMKYHSLKLPNYSAPLIVIALAPIALIMFVFNRSYHHLEPIDLKPIEAVIDGKYTKFYPKCK